MATNDDTRLQQFRHLYTLIGQRNLAEVERFVEQEGITPDEYYSLRLRTPKEGFELMHHDPLWYAALRDAPDIVKYLISLGFDPHGAHLQQKPLHAACAWNCFPITIRIEGHLKPRTPVKADNLEVVRLLVEDHKVDINSVDTLHKDYTPLLHAAEAGSLEVLKFLVKAGADINAKDNDIGNSALHIAARFGSSATCEYFLSLGLNVDETNNCIETALHVALRCKDLTAAGVLLGAGADVRMQDRFGKSYVINALESKNVGALKLLSSHGITIDEEVNQCTLEENLLLFEKDYMYYEDDEYDILWLCLVERGFLPKLEDSYFAGIDYPRVSKLLVACGYKIVPHEYDLELANIRGRVSPENFSDWEKFINDIPQIAENPRTLQELSSFKIRSLLGCNIVESVNSLHLPNALKDILLMKHVKQDFSFH